MESKKVEAYQCGWCGTIYKDEADADQCVFEHARIKLANTLLHKNYPLRLIKHICGFDWDLSEEKGKVTKDNCFKFSHWQCCELPAYQIVSIEEGGFLRMWGKGSWSSGYGNVIPIGKLPKPYPKESLYVYGKKESDKTCD